MEKESGTEVWDIWQKSVNEPFLIYAKSMQVVFVPNLQVQKEIIDTWSNLWGMLPQKNLLTLPQVEENKSDTFSFDSLKDFNDMWTKNWSTFGMELFKWYIQFFQQSTELWMACFKKSS